MIGLEEYELVFITGDGMGVNFFMVSYDGSDFRIEGKYCAGGSDFAYDEISDSTSEIKALGANVDASKILLEGHRIAEYIDNAIVFGEAHADPIPNAHEVVHQHEGEKTVCSTIRFSMENQQADMADKRDDEKEENVKTLKPEEVFSVLPDTFWFSSGAGGWGTEIQIDSTGAFTGEYSDSDMGDAEARYPNGTVYICEFEGKFSEPTAVSPYIYSMKLEYIKDAGKETDIYYKDGIRYIPSDPYGFDNADEFLIYMPGTPISEIEEGFMSWSEVDADIRRTLPEGYYGIYNIGGEEGFNGVEENNIWHSEYEYNFENRKSWLRPSYSGSSNLVFMPEDGPASMILVFDWREDDQTEFEARDYNTGEKYDLEIKISKDHTKAKVHLQSHNTVDLTSWGGTSEGELDAVYMREN